MRLKVRTSIPALLFASTSAFAATISLQPAALTVTTGQLSSLTVQIGAAVDLYAYQFDLGFNPTVLAARSVTEGPFLATGGPTIFVPGTIDNVGGSITFIADILNGPVSGVNGNGTLLTVGFQALRAGSSTVQLFNVTALNSFGQGIAVTTASSTVTVTGPNVPEPATYLLLGAGILGFLALSRVTQASRSASP